MIDPIAGYVPMSVIVDDAGSGIIRLVVTGDVDLATAPELRVALDAALRGATRSATLIVDLAGTTFLDAQGIGALVAGAQAAQRAGLTFAVCNPTGIVRRVLEIAAVATVLQVVVTAEAPPSPDANLCGGSHC